MNSTTVQSSMRSTQPSPSNEPYADEYRIALLAIFSVVLVSGTISMSLMMHILKSTSMSITSIAVLNLVFTHFIFLLTVPFRIHYYATQHWSLGLGFCKIVSSIIHIHMYMSFIFYVVILIMRLTAFYYKAEQQASFRSIHALLVSALVWIGVLFLAPLIISFSYGAYKDAKGTAAGNANVCFRFGRNIEDGAKVFNYMVSMLIIVVAAALTALQANVLRVLYRQHRQGCTSQQDFDAQLKSLCFALIMVVCFIPYHVFRLHYLENLHLQPINEVFLSLTTLNCLDMLTFLGRRTCYVCFLGKGVCL